MNKHILTLMTFIGLSFSAIAQKAPDVPDWVSSAVFYQIYPQTFYDTDGDGIGDLKGMIEKLDYVKSLGVNALWINPFYESPFYDAGYDVADFYKVAPRYGDMSDVEKFIAEAHKRDIKVIFDFVVGHTSIDHPWFKASSELDTTYANWFIWTDGMFANSADYDKMMVQGYSDRDGKYMSNYFWHQPKLNYGFEEKDIKYDWQLPTTHPDVIALKEEMVNILRFWLKKGTDGFRVDMAGSTGEAFWHQVRSMLDDEYPEAFLISEWGEPATAVKAGFHADFMHWFKSYDDLYHKKWFTGGEGYSFFESEGKGDITEFIGNFLQQYNQLKDKGYISVPVDNHDMIRVRNWGRDMRDLEIIYAFQMTFPSLPFVYYGDEIGMRQLDMIGELAVEGSYGSRKGNRTPMQWDASKKNMGFSDAPSDEIYIAMDPAADAPTVSAQINDKTSLLSQTKKLIDLRVNEKALAAYAAFEVLYAEENAYPLVYNRSLENEEILVVLNPSKEAKNITIDYKYDKAKLLAGSGVALKRKGTSLSVSCSGKSYGIYKISK